MRTILDEAAAGRAALVPWTVDRYHQALEAGLLEDDPSVELIDGYRHRVAVVRLARTATAFEAFGCFLQTPQPISLPPLSEPEPDGAVIRGEIDDYLDHPPGPADVLAVIEIADSSLSIDLGPKLVAYASARIPQYVVADLVNDRVLVHEDPAEGSYSRTVAVHRGETVMIDAGAARVGVDASQLLP